MRILVLLLFFLTVYANAFYAFGNVGDGRLQNENQVYRPAGIVNWSLGVGMFDEPQNIIDYKMSFGLSRIGYSYDDGKESVSLYVMDFNLVSWSATYKKFYFEVYGGFSYLLIGTNFSDYMQEKIGDEFINEERFYPKYGYRLGYYVMDNLMVSLTANYNLVKWRFGQEASSWDGENNGFLLMGGIGLSAQYNIF
ncbi:MAG: hypothetical protein MJZ05_02635 [Fibrobacter sp.]|nr:hypothetical protein [Fibrobacter sp.]